MNCKIKSRVITLYLFHLSIHFPHPCILQSVRHRLESIRCGYPPKPIKNNPDTIRLKSFIPQDPSHFQSLITWRTLKRLITTLLTKILLMPSIKRRQKNECLSLSRGKYLPKWKLRKSKLYTTMIRKSITRCIWKSLARCLTSKEEKFWANSKVQNKWGKQYSKNWVLKNQLISHFLIWKEATFTHSRTGT
jgi:hypothetical protein